METEKKLYPLRLVPVESDGASVQCADLGYIDSEVRNGWLSADSLSDIMDTYMDRVVGDAVFAWYGRQFPLLVRTVRVDGSLPLTVCPDDVTAAQRFDFLGKAKLWYIVSASPDSRISIGFRRQVSAAELYEACTGGDPAPLLNTFAPAVGEAYYIAPGTVHAADGHMTICEVAQSSPLDFRLVRGVGSSDDMDDAELTLEEALDFIEYGPAAGAESVASEDGVPVRPLVRSAQFHVGEVRLGEPLQVRGGDSFSLYSCVNGEAAIQYADDGGAPQTVVVAEGESVIVPSDVDSFFLVPRAGRTLLLEITVPEVPGGDEPAAFEEDGDMA